LLDRVEATAWMQKIEQCRSSLAVYRVEIFKKKFFIILISLKREKNKRACRRESLDSSSPQPSPSGEGAKYKHKLLLFNA